MGSVSFYPRENRVGIKITEKEKWARLFIQVYKETLFTMYFQYRDKNLYYVKIGGKAIMEPTLDQCDRIKCRMTDELYFVQEEDEVKLVDAMGIPHASFEFQEEDLDIKIRKKNGPIHVFYHVESFCWLFFYIFIKVVLTLNMILLILYAVLWFHNVTF